MKTDIEKIKDLLFGNEKKALDAITRRLETPEGRTADVADVLPESILRSHAVGKRLVPALQEPVEQCIRTSIQRDPENFADALFPVMGPAIRRSIAEALRSMVQSLNEGIEKSLSISTRFRAWRAGMPIAEYILQRSILYRVEQVYLIKHDDGLLIEHLQRDDIVTRDTDAVSAMYTAIQDFINDSFARDGGDSLTTAVIGDLALWAVHGPHASLVCVIRGVAQAGFRTQLREILEQIHLRHGKALSEYDGGGRIPGVATELRRCLSFEQRKEPAADASGTNQFPWPLLFLIVSLFVLAGWLWFARYSDAQRIEQYRQALDSTPGIVINRIGRVDGGILVRGLRDPLSNSPTDIAPGFLIDPANLRLELAPYQSLDAQIVERRARRLLKPPAGVSLTLDGNRLVLSGSAPAQWQSRARLLALSVAGIDEVDFSQMTTGDVDLLSRAVAALQPPESVTLDVSNARLVGTGIATRAWLLEAVRRLPGIAGIESSDLSEVRTAERVRLGELLTLADGTEVYFDDNDSLRDGQDPVLDRLARQVAEIVSLAAQLDASPRIRVTGYADGTGTPELNRMVESARADRVAAWLTDAGVSPGLIQTDTAAVDNTDAVVQPQMRKARIDVGVVESR